MNVVVVRVVTEQVLERVKRKIEATVVVDRLGRRDGKEEDALTDAHERARVRDRRSERVEYETLHRMVVEGSERVGHVQPVVPRVHVAVEEFVGVEVAVEEVLPGVEYESGNEWVRFRSRGSGTYEAKKNWNTGMAHQYIPWAKLSPKRSIVALPATFPTNSFQPSRLLAWSRKGPIPSPSSSSHTSASAVWITCCSSTPQMTCLTVTRFFFFSSSGSWMRYCSNRPEVSIAWKKSEKIQ